MSKNYYFLTAFILILAIAGCNKEENPTEPGNQNQSSTYVGTVASSIESGSISLDVNLSKSNGTQGAVTGTLKLVSPSQTTINLSGTFSNNLLSVTGGNYSFSGNYSSNSFSGSYNGPN